MKFFINYQRKDEAAVRAARRLADRLERDVSKHNVFMDVDRSDLEWAGEIYRALAEADVLFVIIGPKWLQLLSQRCDYVRVEIAEGLRRKIRVAPILIENATLPNAAELPPDIADLAFGEPFSLRAHTFEYDIDLILSFHKRSAPILSRDARVKRRAPRAEAAAVNYIPLLFAILIGVVLSFAFTFALKPPAVQQFFADRSADTQRKPDRNGLDIADIDIFYVGSDLSDTPVVKAASDDCRSECKRASRMPGLQLCES